jgi:hypothetical protein
LEAAGSSASVRQRFITVRSTLGYKDGLFDELKNALAERVLNAEIDDHLIFGFLATVREPSIPS